MSTREGLVARFKAFLDKNYPCCGVPGCSGEIEEANALVDMAYEVMRPLSLVEIEERRNPAGRTALASSRILRRRASNRSASNCASIPS